MSLQTILKGIETTGELAVAEKLAEARAEKEKILAAARAKAAAQAAQEAHAARIEDGGLRAQAIHSAQMSAQSIVSAAEEAHLQELFRQLEERLAGQREVADYPQLLRDLADEALAALGADESAGAQLIADPRDLPLLAAMELPVTLRAGARHWGGVIVSSGDGRVTIDNTLGSRLRQARPQISKWLVEQIHARI